MALKTGSAITRFARLWGILLVAILAFTMLMPAAQANPRYASIVIDADTGEVIHSRYADKKLHPASLTKMMTLLLTFEALENGELGLNDRVRISRRAASMVPSKLGLEPGQSIRVGDAILVLVTKSANDIAVALAEELAGTEWQFAQKMNNKARELGMFRTHFVNASGLHHPKQISTARDIAAMSRILVKSYGDYYHYFSTVKFTYRGQTYYTHNRLMRRYEGMDGLKTGYINASGFNLAASAERNGRRLVGVVFGGRTPRSRNRHMESLMDRGFSQLDKLRIAHADVPAPGRKPGNAYQLASYDTAINTGADADVEEQFQRDVQTYATLRRLTPDRARSFLSYGQGDRDPDLHARHGTTLLTLAAHMRYIQGADDAAGAGRDDNSPGNAAAPRPADKPGHIPGSGETAQKTGGKAKDGQDNNWMIQIGIFKDPDYTRNVLNDTREFLPWSLSRASARIEPIQTASGSRLYRARFAGLDQNQAAHVCRYLDDCLPIAPGR